MLLNARQIHFTGGEMFQPLILLVFQDVTEIMSIADTVNIRTHDYNSKLAERTAHLEMRIVQLQNQIDSSKIHAEGS